MAKGDRAKKAARSHYHEGLYNMKQSTRDGIWLVFDGSIQVDGVFPSLHDARVWCKEHPADPEYEGKHA